nr:uncharacterized protein LOC104098532 [Nicotiana tomentosiformis]
MASTEKQDLLLKRRLRAKKSTAPAVSSETGLDQQIYNLPTASEVAAIWVKENSSNVVQAPHIRIYTSSNRSQLVNYYYGYYDPLQYPLLFSYGQGGWHCGIKKIMPATRAHRQTISCQNEELPNIRNMCSINGYLEMEEQVLQWKKTKKRQCFYS